MKLSKQAWNQSLKVFEAIVEHPFNVEMMKGTLDKDKFAYYIEQDRIYLNDYARCYSLATVKGPSEISPFFLKCAHFVTVVEQELIHQYFSREFSLKQTGRIAPATIGYTSYLIRVAIVEPVEVIVASILPCLWLYREVGLYITEHAEENNPYAHWIETYSGEEFKSLVLEATHIFDELASRTTEAIRQKMLEAYYFSSCYEWHFWNDSYHLRMIDDFSPNHEICKTF